ncbi:MAG: PDZ domain-containing protein [Planctomycetota bacterium]
MSSTAPRFATDGLYSARVTLATLLTAAVAMVAATTVEAAGPIPAPFDAQLASGGPSVRVAPGFGTPTHSPAHRQWYFGMSLDRRQTPYGVGLRVVGLTHGGPAHRAGLEIGDTLLVAGGTSLSGAWSNEHGVQLLQSAVAGGGGAWPAPTGPAPTVTTVGLRPSVAPNPGEGYVSLTVLDIRTGGTTQVAVRPTANQGGWVGGPAPTAVR